MVKHALGLAFVAALGLGSTAHAADLTVVTEDVVIAAPAFSWTGFYAGGHAGYGWADLDNDLTDAAGDGNKPDGFFGGGQVGYNYQFSNQIVLGLEADAAFADFKDDIAAAGPDGGMFTAYTKITALGTVLVTAHVWSAEHEPALSGEMLSIWLGLYAAYFFSTRQAAMRLAFMASAYLAVLVATTPLHSVAAGWLTLVGILFPAAGVLRAVRDGVTQLVQRLSEAVLTDTLTGLRNRLALDRELQTEVERTRSSGRPRTGRIVSSLTGPRREGLRVRGSGG